VIIAPVNYSNRCGNVRFFLLDKDNLCIAVEYRAATLDSARMRSRFARTTDLRLQGTLVALPPPRGPLLYRVPDRVLGVKDIHEYSGRHRRVQP